MTSLEKKNQVVHIIRPPQVQTAAIPAMNDELPKIQEGVYYRAINQRTDVLDFFLSENGQPRYNPQVRWIL